MKKYKNLISEGTDNTPQHQDTKGGTMLGISHKDFKTALTKMPQTVMAYTLEPVDTKVS